MNKISLYFFRLFHFAFLCSALCGASPQIYGALQHENRPTSLEEFAATRSIVDTQQYPFSAIGRVNGAGIDRRSHCTATLISPKHILTAAHCLYFKARKRWFLPNELHFLAGYNRGDFITHGRIKTIAAKGAYDPNKSLDKVNIEGDWAILTLTETVDIPPIPLLALRDTKAEQKFQQVGYQKRQPHVQTLNPACNITGQFSNILLHDCMLAPGDSGSPILYETEGKYYIVALNSAAIQNNKTKSSGLAIASGLLIKYISNLDNIKDSVQ